MAKMIAYCGLTCTDCDAYKATKKDDNGLRAEVAAKWTKEYSHPFKAEDINCTGCTSTGIRVGYTAACPIRKCAVEKDVMNCGWCTDYPCSGLNELFQARPDAKKNLDAVKQKSKF
jgi:hypothetical protein